MFELLSFVFGGIFRLAPKLIEMHEKQKDREHEREMFAKQLEADKARAEQAMQHAEMQGRIAMDRAEVEAIIAATRAQAEPLALTGNKWIDAVVAFAEVLSKLVRPLLTYWYCIAAYGAYKIATLYIVLSTGVQLASAVTQLWTPNDHAVMFSIIGFWFVDRAVRTREVGK